jgi:hypothetical protein
MNKRESPRLVDTIDRESIEKEKRELLSGFNFELQRDIIRQFAIKAGIQEPHLAPKEAVSDYNGPGQAHYDRGRSEEYLGISFNKLFKIEPDPVKRKLLFWHILNHEQIHAATSDADGTSGYQPSLAPLFELWNEGVTEIVARAVTKEFYIANGYSAAKVPGGYPVQVEFVELVAKKVSEVVGVGPEAVQEAIICGMFLRHIFDEGLEELLASVLPSDLFKKFAFASNEDMQQFIDSSKPEKLELDLKDVNPTIYKRFWYSLLALLGKIQRTK